MSKKELKAYLRSLKKEELEDQLLDLYSRFKPVKTYYNFVFNPKEKELIETSKFKIRQEYFPVSGRKAKMRRSVAQKWIRHFETLGMKSDLILDVMLFNLETAQAFTLTKTIRQESFYKSMITSYEQALRFASANGLLAAFQERFDRIEVDAAEQKWLNADGFERLLMTWYPSGS